MLVLIHIPYISERPAIYLLLSVGLERMNHSDEFVKIIYLYGIGGNTKAKSTINTPIYTKKALEIKLIYESRRAYQVSADKIIIIFLF